jgi:hypothetical protein
MTGERRGAQPELIEDHPLLLNDPVRTRAMRPSRGTAQLAQTFYAHHGIIAG